MPYKFRIRAVTAKKGKEENIVSHLFSLKHIFKEKYLLLYKKL